MQQKIISRGYSLMANTTWYIAIIIHLLWTIIIALLGALLINLPIIILKEFFIHLPMALFPADSQDGEPIMLNYEETIIEEDKVLSHGGAFAD